MAVMWRADAAAFLGLATAPDDAALHWAFAGLIHHKFYAISLLFRKRAQKHISEAEVASSFKKISGADLSNIIAFACIRRMREFGFQHAKEPELAPVSVKRCSLSDPEHCECSSTRLRMPRMPLSTHGVEWSPVIRQHIGRFRRSIGKAASKSSMAFFFAAKFPSSPYMSVYL